MFDGVRKLIQQWKVTGEIDTAKAFTKIGYMGFSEPLKLCILHLSPVKKTLGSKWPNLLVVDPLDINWRAISSRTTEEVGGLAPQFNPLLSNMN